MRDGVDLNSRAQVLQAAIDSLDLEAREVGATNINEQGTLMYNQCFYLSLARAYLSADDNGGEPARELLEETALHLKRVIEAAVLRVHPEWAGRQVSFASVVGLFCLCSRYLLTPKETGRQVGEHLQAFSDFLFYVMHCNALMSELAVAVMDATSGVRERACVRACV